MPVSSLLIALSSGSLLSTSMLVQKLQLLTTKTFYRLVADRLYTKLSRLRHCNSNFSVGLPLKVLHRALTFSKEIPAQDRATFKEVCILDSAKCSNRSELLLDAVKKREYPLVNTIIKHGMSLDHCEGAVLQIAISGYEAALICSMLRGRVSPSTLETVIPKPITHLAR